MQTRISHITYYVDLKPLYIQFLGCNLHCPWCIRKLIPWDHHLDKETLMGIKFQGLFLIEGNHRNISTMANTITAAPNNLVIVSLSLPIRFDIIWAINGMLPVMITVSPSPIKSME